MFKITVFNKVLDKIISQLNTRFDGMSKVYKIFDFLTPKTLLNIEEGILLKKCDQFKLKYSNVIRTHFWLQYLNVYHLILPKLTETTAVHQLCMEIITKFGVIECDITEVYIAITHHYTITHHSCNFCRS